MRRTFLIADQVLRNAAMAVPAVARWRTRRGRTSTLDATPTPADLQRYAYDVYELVVESLGARRIEGACVAELGPGDHVPAGLLFLAAGAERYLAIDRFAGDVAGPAARRLYAALGRDLEERHPALASTLRARGIDPARFPDGSPGRVEIVPRSVEEVHGPELADLVVSHNVLEHVSDVAAVASNTWALLRPDGMAVHRVDFDAHDVWRERQDPLEWLTIADPVWRLMGSQRGCPNRVRFHEFIRHFQAAGFEVEATILERFPAEQIAAGRDRLAGRFRNMPVDSLAVRTARFVCRKP